MSVSTSKDAWSAQTYNKNASFVYSDTFTSPVLSLLDPKPGEKIVDFGCGSGELTAKIGEVVTSGDEGVIVGVDSSENMLAKARLNGLKNLVRADLQAPLPESELLPPHAFDAVFSNAAFHWCKRDPRGVLANAKALLKKDGGRFVAEMGGYLNVVGVRSALHEVLRKRGFDPVKLDPWYFPSDEEYRELLESSGFEVQQISLHPRMTTLPGRLYDWLVTFCRNSCLEAMSDEEAQAIMEEVEKICEVDCKDFKGRWTIMYVRLRFVAVVKT
ncbi:S-adenosyl-L-methionine-dependent methyltransferase [Panus rudis PR-1116 ss-1]|nr:S-adenosyl-L-methionine-dependent methyltransferase [Panus rudis PR-1116 ss-1]